MTTRTNYGKNSKPKWIFSAVRAATTRKKTSSARCRTCFRPARASIPRLTSNRKGEPTMPYVESAQEFIERQKSRYVTVGERTYFQNGALIAGSAAAGGLSF